jgi:NADH-quinone oxidoreductase subunit L
MGGMRKHLPVAFWSFVIGSAALTALPFTSGYFSKDEILLAALESGGNGTLLWAGGVLGAFFTAIYSFRLVFVVFFGECHHPAKEITGFNMAAPLMVLAVLALTGGLIHPPVEAVFGHGDEGHGEVGFFQHALMIAVPIIGVVIAYLFFCSKTWSAQALVKSATGAFLHRFWFSGWGMDRLYQTVFVTPFISLAKLNRRDVVDLLVGLLVTLTSLLNRWLVKTQTGYLRWYAASVITGVIVLIAIGALL